MLATGGLCKLFEYQFFQGSGKNPEISFNDANRPVCRSTRYQQLRFVEDSAKWSTGANPDYLQ